MGAGTARAEDSESDSKKEEFGVRDCMCGVKMQIRHGGDSQPLTGKLLSFLRRGNIYRAFDQTAGMKSQTSEPASFFFSFFFFRLDTIRKQNF